MNGRVLVRNNKLVKMLELQMEHPKIKMIMNLESLYSFRVPEECFDKCRKIFGNCTSILEENDE